MGPVKVRIHFASPVTRYSPRDWIRGTVLLHTEREKQILGIDMNLIGKTKVSCTSAEKYHAFRPTPTMRANSHKYFLLKQTKSLRRQEDNGGEVTRLPKGTYEYPFEFTLPEGIPASFEGPYGWVRYRLEVIIKYSFWDHSCEAEAPFYVTGKYDLNHLDTVYREVKVATNFLYMYNQYGATFLELIFELEKRAYVPGDVIRFAATPILQNESMGHPPIQGVRVSFVQEQTYRILDKVRQHTSTLHEVVGPMVVCNRIEVWNGSITINPAIQPTSLGGDCRFIDVQYFLKVNIWVTQRDKIDFNIKMMMGTVPILRRRPRNQSSGTGSQNLQRQLSLEIPLPSPVSLSPEQGPSTSRGQGQGAMMDFLSVTPGPSRRASAPPLWLGSEIGNAMAGGSTGSSPLPVYSDVESANEELETPPPTYSDAVFFSSEGFLESVTTPQAPGDNGTTTDSDALPEYQRQPPFFLRKGAKHLYDSNNAYATL